jgi:hypothetical protein
MQTPASAIEYDLLYIGDYVSNICITGFDGNASYVNFDTIKFDSQSANTTNAPYGIDIQGIIASGNGGGVNVAYGRNIETVAGILRLWWTGRTFPFILPVQPFSEEGQL